jgi:hypothetical protein
MDFDLACSYPRLDVIVLVEICAPKAICLKVFDN